MNVILVITPLKVSLSILHVVFAPAPPTAGELLSQYGWYLMVVTVLVYLLIQHLSKRRSSQSDRSAPPQTPQGTPGPTKTCLLPVHSHRIMVRSMSPWKQTSIL